MNKKMSKRQQDLKSKLMAAICMLLVSSIMMVSTTYAWFTLSTAPEVTGITTAVGANGNLEMALLNEKSVLAELDDPDAVGGIKSAVGDSVAATENYKVSNITWGNLVDLSTGYGMDQITLYPAALNVDETNKIKAMPLETPVYGADGRVADLTANTSFGMFQDNAFVEIENGYGVRAIGKSADMTPRQASFRIARSNINSYVSSAETAIAGSLNEYGTVLADPVIQGAMGDGAVEYNQTHVDGLSGLVSGLEQALVHLDKAYMNVILAAAASNLNTIGDPAWQAVADLVNAENATLATVQGGLPAGFTLATIDANLASYITAYESLADKVAEIRGDVTDLRGKTSLSEQDFTNVVAKLANPSGMKIDKYSASEIKQNMNALIPELMGLATSGNLKVYLSKGGAYQLFADHIGNYNAPVKIESLGLNTTMVTTTEQLGGVGYVPAMHAALQGKEPVTDGSATKTLSDFYGYVIDLAFRTNAADSDLLLQIDPTDRIYTDNPSETTMGGGSYMEFTAGSPDFTLEQMENLMGSIKIVFFNPADGTIINRAYLDIENADRSATGVKADIHMEEGGSVDSVPAVVYHGDSKRYYGSVSYGKTATDDATKVETTEVTYIFTNSLGNNVLKEVVTKTYTPESGEGDDKVSAETKYGTSKFFKYENGTWATTETDATTAAGLKVEKTSEGELVMSLNQNEAAPVSVLVYLDGESVTNADVAYNSATSMTGTMNLQFCSSANLQPMRYGGELELPAVTTPPADDNDNTQSGGGNGGATGTAMTAVKAAADSVATIKSASFTGSTVTIELDGFDAATEEVTSITVAGTAITTVQPSDAGVLTFTSEGVAADTAVVVTIAAKAPQG